MKSLNKKKKEIPVNPTVKIQSFHQKLAKEPKKKKAKGKKNQTQYPFIIYNPETNQRLRKTAENLLYPTFKNQSFQSPNKPKTNKTEEKLPFRPKGDLGKRNISP